MSSQNKNIENAYDGLGLGRSKTVERDEKYVYGNDTIGHYETRHKAIGEAAIHARKDPFPFGEDFEHRSPDRRRKDILHRTGFVYTYERRDN